MKALREFILSSGMLKAVFYHFSESMASYCFIGCLLFLIVPGTAVGCTPPVAGVPETPMVYRCGLILSASQTTHVIVINPNGNSMPDNHKNYLEEYLQQVGDTPYLGMVEEYGGSSHSTYAGEFSEVQAGPTGLHYVDDGLPSTSPSSVSFILEKALGSNPSWNSGPSDEYFVLLPPNATVEGTGFPFSFCVGLQSYCDTILLTPACGYHGTFVSPSRGAVIYYAVIGYGGDCETGITKWPAGLDQATFESTLALAHEQLEIITDPDDTGWWSSTPAAGISTPEVMDQCRPDTDWQQRADGTNVHLKSQWFLLPKMWSNFEHSCLRPGPFGQVKNATQEVGINTIGTLEVFGLGTDGQVWHDYQANVPGGWSGWGIFSAPWNWSINPVVGTNSDGRLELFEVGPDQQMWHLWQDVASFGPWSGGSLGGQFQSTAPAVAANADGRLEVFALGTDGQVWHNYQVVPNGDWAGWSSIAPAPWSWTVGPSVGIDGDGRLELFEVGPDHQMYHLYQDAPSSPPWHGGTLGGQFQSMIPAVATNADGILQVFALGTDGQVWHNYQNASEPGGWQGWIQIGAPWNWNVPPVVGINGDGRLEIFMVGPDKAMWHLWQNCPNCYTSWSGGSLGGSPDGGFKLMAPTVGNNADGRLEVFAIGAGGGMWHNYQMPNGGWSGWGSLPGIAFSQM